jgi:hypothetical protein
MSKFNLINDSRFVNRLSHCFSFKTDFVFCAQLEKGGIGDEGLANDIHDNLLRGI